MKYSLFHFHSLINLHQKVNIDKFTSEKGFPPLGGTQTSESNQPIFVKL